MKRLLTILVALLSASSLQVGAQNVVINEIMQSNVNGIMYKGDFPDSWVELYNDSRKATNIQGWRIGLERNFDAAWEFSHSMHIGAASHLLVYCDKVDNGYQHTDFHLDAHECTIYLWDANGTIVDSLRHPQQPAPGVAYGRTEDGGEEWDYEVTTTPGASNQGVFTHYLMPDPTFSLTGRLLDHAGQELTVSIPDLSDLPADTRLYVTTDGSFPTTDSPSYTRDNPFRITLNRTTVVRARLLSAQGLTNVPATHSYILHPRSTRLPVFSLTCDSLLLWGDSLGMLIGSDYHANCYKGWRRPIHFEMYEQDQPDRAILNQLGEAGMHGAGSMLHNQKAMNLYTSKRWQKKRFDASRFWPHKSHITRTKTFCLRNGGSRCADSRLEDAFVQLLFAEHIGRLEYLDYRPAIVYINGRYRGLYDLRERANNTFAANNYGIDEDAVSEIEDMDSTDPIYRPVRNLIWSDSPTYEALCRYFDMPLLLDYTCCQAFATNTLFPSANVFMWVQGDTLRPDDPTCRIHPVLKDLDELASTAPTTNWYNFITLQGTEGTWGSNYNCRRLYAVLFGMKEFQDAFLDRMQTYLGDFCKPSVTVPMVQQMRAEIEDEIPATFEVLDEGVTYADFADRIDRMLIPYLEQRPMIHYRHLAAYYGLGEVVPMRISTLYSDDDGLNWESLCIKVNGIRLTEGDFDGALFSSRSVRLDTGNDELGWRITLTDALGRTQTLERRRSSLSFCLADYGTGFSSIRFDPTPIDQMGIENITIGHAAPQQFFDLVGRPIQSTSRGLSIIRDANGNIRKTFCP